MPEKLIIGVDEAGRGALVGPVYAACCAIITPLDLSQINDSKKLTAEKREKARGLIKKACIYSMAFADEKEIDSINILQATFLAMQRAFDSFVKKAYEKEIDIKNADIIVDGNKLPPFLEKYSAENLFADNNAPRARAVIKADALVPAVMASSILAKTERDRFMLKMDEKYPQYDYKTHKGYGTKKHIELIKKYGLSPIARRTFHT